MAVSNVTAPAQKHATDAAVYTALFLTTKEGEKEISFSLFKFDAL